MRKLVSLLTVLMLLCASALAQPRTVTGKVIDAQGKPVPYASVLVKGTNTGVAADANGDFSIQAPPNSILVFSASGLKSFELNIGNQTSVTANLSSQTSMSEVIVTALGVRRTRNQVPYAAQQITGEEVNKARTSNFVQNLSGKVAGLEMRQSNSGCQPWRETAALGAASSTPARSAGWGRKSSPS